MRLRFLPRACVLASFLLAAAWPAPGRVAAQATVSPYFMVVVDTSGSMDGTTGTGNNSCGRARTRLSDARCVLQRVFNAYGEVNFGLSTFNTTCTGGTYATPCVSGLCGCTSCGTTCTATATSGRVRVPIGTDNTPTLLSWVDYAGGGVCTATSGTNLEIIATGGTPLGGTLLRMQDYYQGEDPAFPTSPLAGDPFVGCRSVNVILLTDGGETCGGNAPAAATALRSTVVTGVGTVTINTYVIGFGIAPGDAAIEAIGRAGRGIGGDPPGNEGYYATDETSLALAFSQIIADATRVEVCDGDDDDCDTRIDEGFALFCNRPSNPTANLCVDPGETLCDGVDNNCNGVTDEGLRNACGTCGPAPVEVCNRLDDNCNGAIDEGGVCGSCVPSSEACNNRDDDCDTRIDESLVRPCGTDTGVCSAGTQTCTAGVFGACTGVGPSTEVCNALDDDCDGVIDGLISACGTDVGACVAGSQSCTAGVLGACFGAVGPTAELCNATDDDCDGSTDEGNPSGGASCGSSVGECSPGALSCVGGLLVCAGGTSGSPETCNTLDDDCDGRVDEGNPGGGASCGGSDVGACEPGILRCIAGAITCDGEVGPIPERCNTLDDDCDGTVDEGNPEGGADCGDGTGECQVGRTQCIGGTLTCDGAVGPAMETCNGLDDDCDGAIDDEIPVGAACGTDVGECDPGVFACDPVSGTTVCVGEVGPTAEACNLLDDDCDGSTDEALASAGACGTDEGVCMAGILQCVDGAEICVGEVPAGTEVCDCEDNDCDGTIDEEPTGGSLCPGTSACVECSCAAQCEETEFGFLCPTGRFARVTDGECYCVRERCNEAACNGETQTDADGAVTCAPGSDEVAPCTCRSNTCTFACDGVVCAGGTVCDARDPDGRCVEDNCRGLGCPAGEVCDFATGGCTADLCETAGCAADEACRDGTCFGSCAGVTCPTGSVCRSGACELDLCDGVSCRAGEACDPSDGGCVDDMCPGRVCGEGTICEPATGECREDLCNRTTCPDTEVCEDGECVRPGERPDAGMPMRDAGRTMDAGREPRRVLGTGGSLCSAAPRSGSGFGLMALVLGAVLLGARRRNTVRAEVVR
jgi:hypothetical protein